ncbi:MAG: DUF2911 domain-containing protein [Sediminibacterium sp.]
MKKLMMFAATLCSMTAFAQIRMPAPSSTQKIIQDFGMGTIELIYSRPNIKGRSLLKEKSDLAPLNKLWRTGANAATKIKFTDRVTMGGKSLDTGTYVLYTIPGKDLWEIIINKGVSNWGTDGYKESEDVVRFKVKTEKMNVETETFTMQFANIAPESCDLLLKWGYTTVRVPISTNIKDRLRAQVEKALSAEEVNPNTYQAAATFYFEWDKDLNKALTNITKGTQANPTAFWLFLLQAKIQKALGDKIAAKASAEKCIALAAEAKNDDYVKQGNDLIKKL